MQNKPEYARLLPHYHLIGATFFVTFRLSGSLPQEFLHSLRMQFECEKEDVLLDQPPGTERDQTLFTLQSAYFQKWDAELDQCQTGPTFLQQPLVADCVRNQLNRFDGTWYHLLAYTMLPNHLHCLLDFSAQQNVQSVDYQNLDVVMNRIKGASARAANQLLGRQGLPFWQPEYHNRYIRNPLHLRSAVNYIKQNPVSAKLCLHWMEHPFTWVTEALR